MLWDMPRRSVGRDPRSIARRREIVLRQRYGLLLVCLFALFVFTGVAPGGPWQDTLVTALAATTLILSLRAGDVTPRMTAVFTVIGTALVLIVAGLALTGVSNAAVSRVTAFALVAVAPPAICTMSGRFAPRWPTGACRRWIRRRRRSSASARCCLWMPRPC